MRNLVCLLLLLVLTCGNGCASLLKVGTHVLGHLTSECIQDTFLGDDDDESLGDEHPPEGTD